MKLAIGTALAVLLAGSMAYAQEQDKEKEKPPAHEEKKPEPAKQQPKAQEHQQQEHQQQEHQQQDRQQQQQHAAQEQQKDRQKAEAHQNEKEHANAEKQQQQIAKQQQQVARQQEHVSAQQAQRDGGNRNARRIREEDFHSHFGREHEFRVRRSDDRRFNYGGYWFVYNDPWPSDWSYSDDVYVDEIDGEYYLVDPVHPGLRLLIVVAD